MRRFFAGNGSYIELPYVQRPIRSDYVAVVAVSLLVGAWFGLSFGDGDSNHPVYLVPGLRLFNPAFLEHDWWATQTTHYHRVFPYLVAGLQAIDFLHWGLALLNIASVAVVMAATFGIARRLDPESALPAWLLFVAIFFVAGKTRSVATTFLFSPSLQPSSISTLGFVLALYALVAGRYWVSGAFLALSGLFHTNYLVLAFPFFGMAHLLMGRRALVGRCFAQFLPLFLVFAWELPNIVHVMGLDLPAGDRAAANQILLLAIPYHLQPNPMTFGVLLGWGLVALPQLHGLGRGRVEGRNFTCLFWSFFGLLILTLAITENFEVSFVNRLFVSRMAPFALMFAQLAVAIVVVRILLRDRNEPEFPASPWRMAVSGLGVLTIIRFMGYFGSWTDTDLLVHLLVALTIAAVWLARRLPLRRVAWLRPLLTTGAVLVLLTFLGRGFDPAKYNLLYSVQLRYSDMELNAWARTTDPASRFVIPPGIEDFRLQGERAVVFDWKAVPYRPDELLEWHRRARAVTGAERVFTRRDMDTAYNGAPYEHLAEIARRYDAQYVAVRRGTPAASSNGEKAFEGTAFIVFRVP